MATALAARTTTFQPLIAVRPGYRRPAHFASAAATLDHLTGGRVLVNIVSVDRAGTSPTTASTTGVTGSTGGAQRPVVMGERRHTRLSFGGASEAGERLGRELPPPGVRAAESHTLVSDTTEQAWADAEAKVARMARGAVARDVGGAGTTWLAELERPGRPAAPTATRLKECLRACSPDLSC
ncbi:hypothetical protein GCM10020220_037000 [Nonomuraea rubra]